MPKSKKSSEKKSKSRTKVGKIPKSRVSRTKTQKSRTKPQKVGKSRISTPYWKYNNPPGIWIGRFFVSLQIFGPIFVSPVHKNGVFDFCSRDYFTVH